MAAAKPSQVTPQHCQDAVRSIVGILDGLTYLCKYDNDGKVQELIGKIFYPLFILICAMTRYIKTVPLAQKLDKGLMELSAEFLVRLKKCWKAKDFVHIQVVLKSPKLSQYRNLMTIYLTLRPIDMLIEHQRVIETAVADQNCRPEFLFQILTRVLKLSKQMLEKDDLSEEEFEESKQLLEIIPRGCRYSATSFATILAATEKLKLFAEDNQWMADIIYQKIIPDVAANSKIVTNEIARQNTRHLELCLTPTIPNSIGNVEHSEVFFNQLKLTNEGLISESPKMRLTALQCFEKWCTRQWSSLRTQFPEHTKRNLENVLIMALDDSLPDIQLTALKTVQSIFLNEEGSRHLIGAMIQTRSQPDDPDKVIQPEIDLSACLASPNQNTRKEFVMLLRIFNKSNSVRVSKVCPVSRIFAQLRKENNDDVQEAIAGLFKHHYFPVTSALDKGNIFHYNCNSYTCILDGVMKVVKGLVDMFKVHGTNSVRAFIQKAMYRYLVATEDPQVRIIPAALLRKFGHQIWSSWADKIQDGECIQPSAAIMTSLQISSYLWSKKVQVISEDENLSSIVKETYTIWNNILVETFGNDNVDNNVRKLLLSISFNFKADDIDRISIPVRSSFKRGHDNPELPITALIAWKHIGDVWSIITDWIAYFIQHDNRRKSRSAGIRFEENRDDELEIEDILKYIKCLLVQEKAYESAACNDVAEFVMKLEEAFLRNFETNSSERLNGMTVQQLQMFTNLKAKIILTAAPSKFSSLMKTEPYFKVITIVISVADCYFRQLSNTVLMQMQKTEKNYLDH